MIRKIVLGGILVAAGLFGSSAQHNAFACNKTAGCVMETFRDDYDMERDGRMDMAIKAGRENVEAFRALQAAQQKASAPKKSPART